MAQAEDAIFHGKGKTIKGKKPSEIVSELYKEGVIDELLEPVVLLDDSGRDHKVQKNDGVFFLISAPIARASSAKKYWNEKPATIYVLDFNPIRQIL